MHHHRQVELLRRLEQARPSLKSEPWPLAEEVYPLPASTYIDPSRFAKELNALFRNKPVLVALSCELIGPGSFMTADLGGVPVLAVRQTDGSVKAFVNICRHRAAPVAQGRGNLGGAMTCPYHAWTYELNGELKHRPGAESTFGGAPKSEFGLYELPVLEAHGLVFVRAEGTSPITVAEALQGAETELSGYAMESMHHFETRTADWRVNWKLILDTFLESYHIRTLHRESILPEYLWNASIFDSFGEHTRHIALLRSVLGEIEKPEEERLLLPHATAMYTLVPNSMVTYQRNHIQVWRVTPTAVDRTRVSISLFTHEPATTDKARAYWTKNLDVLLDVTGREDFPMMERIQANLASGAMPELALGRLEPALIHFERSVARALARYDAA